MRLVRGALHDVVGRQIVGPSLGGVARPEAVPLPAWDRRRGRPAEAWRSWPTAPPLTGSRHIGSGQDHFNSFGLRALRRWIAN